MPVFYISIIMMMTIILLLLLLLLLIILIIMMMMMTTTTTTMMMMIRMMIVFLERLSMWNMLSCAVKVQIQKYKTHAYKTPKTACVQTIKLKHPTKQKKMGNKNLRTHKTL